ncbi:hypothetical protein TomTYG75_11120 [Sphingobium sp. TomTYG75]
MADFVPSLVWAAETSGDAAKMRHVAAAVLKVMEDFLCMFVLPKVIRDNVVTGKSFCIKMLIGNYPVDKAFACHDAPR